MDIVRGGYGAKYAGPVYEGFNELFWNDLVNFRDKFLQFMANPDVQAKEFMPSIQ